jgi:hypothetical protein
VVALTRVANVPELPERTSKTRKHQTSKYSRILSSLVIAAMQIAESTGNYENSVTLLVSDVGSLMSAGVAELVGD